MKRLATSSAVVESPLGRRRCTKPGCTGHLEPSVDRHGQQKDECSQCGALYPVGGGAPAGSGNGVSASNGTRNCPVKDCPGRIGADGKCACCANRAAFLERHLPKRNCEVCGGGIASGRAGTKYCKACKPIAQKVQIAKHRADAPTKRK